MRFWAVLGATLALAGCVQSAQPLPPLPPAQGQYSRATAAIEARARRHVDMFQAVVAKLEPVATSQCRAKGLVRNCQFQFVLDPHLGLPANAYQTLDPQGRPIVALTLALLAGVRNADEIAFVLGHEAAHHILGHIATQDRLTRNAAISAGLKTAAQGGSLAEVRRAEAQSARQVTLGYSKTFELEADALGAELAYRAGFDPLRGAAFFDRLPEPHRGAQSTHPGNRARKALVAKVVQGLHARG